MDLRTKFLNKGLKALGIYKFKGSTSPIDADKWINRLSGCFQATRCSKNQKVKLVQLMLQKEAKEQWKMVKQELTNKERSNWKMFRGIFKGEFSTRHYFNLKKKEEFCQGLILLGELHANLAHVHCRVLGVTCLVATCIARPLQYMLHVLLATCMTCPSKL